MSCNTTPTSKLTIHRAFLIAKLAVMNDQQLTSYIAEVKSMSIEQLLVARAGWKSDTAQWQAVDREIARRDARGTNARAWLALAVSVVSLIVSIAVALG